MLLWLKAFHLIFMVAWFVGLFYMFRLFVYHVESQETPETVATLQRMARNLYVRITTPAMLGTLAFGLGMLATSPAYLGALWIQIKLCLVAGLVAYHVYVGRVLRRFARGDVYLTSRQCRIRNEIPALFLVPIVFLAVLRP